jgi:hypothetical protein
MLSGLPRNLRLALDPFEFARACGLEEPDPWQLEVLEVDHEGQDQGWNCCRGAGKSTAAGLVATRLTAFHAREKVLVASPSQDQSNYLLEIIGGFLDGLEVEITTRNVKRLTLANGSTIYAKHGQDKTIRGIQGVRLVILDEAARIPPDLVAALTPMLGVRKGRMLALSTPAGKHPGNFFSRTWHDPEFEGHKVQVTADQCPRLSREFLEKERRRLGDMGWREEYYCEFLDSELAAFSSELIQRAFTDEFSAWAL